MQLSPMEHVYPTNTQLLLIRALLSPDEDFAEHWKRWRQDCGPYADLDEGSLRLFPLLYKKLTRILSGDSWVRVAENAYRFHWLRNLYLMSESEKIIRLLEKYGIPFFLLKGGAFLSLYYENQTGVRSIDDIDIFIPTSHFIYAMQLVGQHPEYRTHTDIRFFRSTFFHEITVYTPRGILDIHCHAFRTYLCDDDWEILQKNSQSIPYMGHQARTLSHTDHFVHVCAYALQWNEVPNARWIIDAVLITRKSSIDWNRVIHLSNQLRVSLSVGDSLKYLRAHQFIAVPDWVIKELSAIRVSVVDRRLYAVTLKDTTSNPFAALELYWWRYVASLQRPFSVRDAFQKLGGFMKFLCQTDSSAQIPVIAFVKGWQLMVRWWQRSFSV